MAQAASPSVAVVPQPIPPLIHAVAGALGGAFALLLFYPLERARIEMQKNMSSHTSNKLPSIVRQSHLGRGGSASRRAAETSPLGGSWSVGGNSSSSSCSDSDEEEDLFADALSEVIDDTPATLSVCIRRLWDRDELYRGVTPIVCTIGASNFVFFFVNELMKRLIFHSKHATTTTETIAKQATSNSYRSLLASCMAGLCNVLLTNPLWVANLRIVTGESRSSQLLAEMLDVARTNGLSHLWSGTGASLLLVSNPVLQFFFYEELKLLQLRASHTKGISKSSAATLPPIQAFLSGAIAKAVATVLTYPLQLTQTVLRMQQHESKDKDSEYHGTWDCLVKLYASDGAQALFTGMRAKLLQTVLTAAFTFLTYEQIATALHATHQSLLANKARRKKLLVVR